MSDAERWVKEMGDVARKQREVEVPHDLARPFDPQEIEALGDVLAEKLPAPIPAPIPIRRAPARMPWALIVAPLAAAAAIALYVGRGERGERSVGALPSYALVVEGSQGTERGDAPITPGAVVHRAASGRLVLVARPREPGPAGAQASVWIERAGVLQAWPVKVEASDEGAFRIVAQGEALAAVAGEATRVVVVIADDAHVPSDGASAQRALAGDGAGVRAMEIRLAVDR